MHKEVIKLHKEVISIRLWILGTGIVCIGILISFFSWQGSWFQKLIDVNQTTTQTQIKEFRRDSDKFHQEMQAQREEFRRDSDKSYELAIKALERSKEKSVSN
jgi:hypothetical protein